MSDIITAMLGLVIIIHTGKLRNLTKIIHLVTSGFLEKSIPLVVIIVGFYSKQSTICVFILGKKHYGMKGCFLPIPV